jgi:hypothetical protein
MPKTPEKMAAAQVHCSEQVLFNILDIIHQRPQCSPPRQSLTLNEQVNNATYLLRTYLLRTAQLVTIRYVI